MSTWNAMSYEGKDTILRVVRDQAQQFLTMVNSDDVWTRPTGAGHWQVRDALFYPKPAALPGLRHPNLVIGGRGGSAAGPVGTSGQAGAGQPAVCRGGEAAAAAVVAGADRGAAQAPGGWNGSVVRTTSVARGDLPGDLRRAAR